MGGPPGIFDDRTARAQGIPRPFLDTHELTLVIDVLTALPPAARAPLDEQLGRLRAVAALAATSAVTLTPDALMARIGDDAHDVDLRLPVGAALAAGFVLAKIGFLRDLSTAAREAELPRPVLLRADLELTQSIHSLLVEELFLSVAGDGGIAPPIRAGACASLIRLWSHPLELEIDDVAPLLDAVWNARRSMRPVLGTLLGTVEVAGLFQRVRDERFLDYFLDERPAEERAAYEEFLFGLSTEDLAALRAEMRRAGRSCVSLADAHTLLGRPASAPWPGEVPGPEAVVISYRSRRERARQRVIAGVPGPRRTAEEYLVIAHLMAGLAL